MSQELTPQTEVQDIPLDDESEAVPYTYEVASYGADFLVDGLIDRLDKGDIQVPSFQRGYVWKGVQPHRFIESLLLGLPIPGIFLYREEDSRRLMVIDGQQRLKTLQYFHAGRFGRGDDPESRPFILQGVAPQFAGKTYQTLPDEDRRRLDDSVIHATIIEQKHPSDDLSSMYYIFERLNTGGTDLQPQEIRAAIFSGTFNSFLGKINNDKTWRSVYGPASSRMKDQELILRFFALYYSGSSYSPPMKVFLNRFMGTNRELQKVDASTLEGLWASTISFIAKAIPKRPFRPETTLNAAAFDSVMVGTARRLKSGPIHDSDGYVSSYDQLLQDEAFKAAITRATAQKESVQTRLKKATEAFAALK